MGTARRLKPARGTGRISLLQSTIDKVEQAMPAAGIFQHMGKLADEIRKACK